MHTKTGLARRDRMNEDSWPELRFLSFHFPGCQGENGTEICRFDLYHPGTAHPLTLGLASPPISEQDGAVVGDTWRLVRSLLVVGRRRPLREVKTKTNGVAKANRVIPDPTNETDGMRRFIRKKDAQAKDSSFEDPRIPSVRACRHLEDQIVPFFFELEECSRPLEKKCPCLMGIGHKR